jgi:hypothetical protein
MAKREVLLSLAASPSAQQLETLTLNGIVLPDMECAVKLLCMPNLRLLGGKLCLPGNAYDTPASLDMPWPEGKPPMELQLECGNARQLAALPLEHFSSITIATLDFSLMDVAGTLLREQIMQALLAAARKCPEFVIEGIGGHSNSGAMWLALLGPGCPIKLSGSCCFECVCIDLEAADVQGIAAAWGRQLKELVLKDTYLSSRAWAAITPTAFPVLERIEFQEESGVRWAPQVTALCMEWPTDRKLSLTVSQYLKGECGHAEDLANDLQSLLAARGRQHIKFHYQWLE